MADVIDSSASTSTGRYLLNAASLFLLRLSKLVVGLGAVVAAILYIKQDSMLYFPGMYRKYLAYCALYIH